MLGLSALTACAPHSDATTSSSAKEPSREPAPIRKLYDTVRLDFDPQHIDAYRFIDREAGVVCYTIDEHLSCLPITQTRLAQQQPK